MIGVKNPYAIHHAPFRGIGKSFRSNQLPYKNMELRGLEIYNILIEIGAIDIDIKHWRCIIQVPCEQTYRHALQLRCYTLYLTLYINRSIVRAV